MLFHSNIYVDDSREVFKSGLISFWLVSFVQISLSGFICEMGKTVILHSLHCIGYKYVNTI